MPNEHELIGVHEIIGVGISIIWPTGNLTIETNTTNNSNEVLD